MSKDNFDSEHEPEANVTDQLREEHYADEQHHPQRYAAQVAAPVSTLDFEKGYCEMNLATLSRTMKMEFATGKPQPSRPVNHFELIERLAQQAMKRAGDVEVNVQQVIAAEAQARRLQWAGEKGKCPVENYYIERVVTKIVLLRPSRPEISMALAFSFNERGISIAFGPEVRVCSNQNIFGDNIVTTYGSKKVPFEKMLELTDHWMQNLGSHEERDLRLIEHLQNAELDNRKMYEIIGQLYHNATLWNEGQKELNAPLSMVQVGQMVREKDRFMASRGEDAAPVTAWDFTNFATSVLKPRNSDMITMLEDNRNLNNFLLDAFEISLN